jgi:hypothetical protein
MIPPKRQWRNMAHLAAHWMAQNAYVFVIARK